MAGSKWNERWQRYLKSVLLVVLATLVNEPLTRAIAPTNLVMSYLAIVVVAAIYLGRGPAILAAVLSVLSFDFFFVPPRFTMDVSDTEYLLTFLGLFIVGLVVSTLVARVREQAEAAGNREAQTAALYAFSQALASAQGLEQIVHTIVVHLRHNLGLESTVSLCTPDQDARCDTDTSSASSWISFPLKAAHTVVGVLNIERPESVERLTTEQQQLVEIFASQAALAIERHQLGEQARQAELSQAKETLQAALLDSVSHDLRTPLVSITGALSSLAEEGIVLDQETRQSLIETAYGEAKRLNRLMRNLLDMTRIDSGAMIVRREPCEILDLIGSALEQMGDRLDARAVNLDIAPDLPLVPLDFVLIVQVLVNVLENAVKYSPEDAAIDLQARVIGDHLEMSVADRGPGIPPEDLERVFQKFYRVQRPGSIKGTGLGLSICKGIIEAHGGRIRAENRSGGGAKIRITLPIQQSPYDGKPGTVMRGK